MNEPYKQSDPLWGSKHLGTSGLDMSGFGCYVTALAEGMRWQGINVTPGELCDMGNILGWFGPDGMLSAWRLNEIYPLQMVVSKQTKTPAEPPLDIIRDYLNKGYLVILQVDLSPNNHINEGDHFVYCYRIGQGNDLGIKDPFYGTDTVLSEHYGKTIYGYRIFKKIESAKKTPMNIQNNSFVRLTEGPGGFGWYNNGKLYVDDLAKVIACYIAEKEGVRVGASDWDSLIKVNLKNESL